jgi:hypothetical protein
MIAFPAVWAGNWIVKVPLVTVLSPPKLIAQTALFAVNPVIEVVL